MGITDMILGLIGMIIYPLFSIIFVAVDGLQTIFFAFAGIGDMKYGNGFTWTNITSGNSGVNNDTGIVYYLMTSDLVKNLLLSIMLLALFLIVIFTVMAFIKNAYSAKQKGWKEIIGNSIKGLANFIFLPVCCLLGVWLGNILLQAINGATSSGGATLMSRKLFIAAAYNANHCRNAWDDPKSAKGVVERAYALALYNKDELPFKKSDIKDGLTVEEYANMVDELYASPCISIYEWVSVTAGYSLWQINYLVIIVGGIFMLYVLGSLCFAMVRRIFFLLMLFIISPGICAMYPLDEGKAVGQWSSEVKKLVLSAYGAVAGMNIFFSLLPLVDNLHVFGDGVLFDDLLGIFVMVCGLLVVKELISTISNLVGGEDAYSKGSSLMKATTGAMKKYGGGMAKGIAKFTGGVQGRLKAGQKHAFWGQVGSTAGGLGWKSLSAVTGGMVDIPGLSKERKDALKDAKEHAWDGHDSRTGFAKEMDDANFKSLFKKFVINENGEREKIDLAPGEQIDTMKIFDFLNSVKDEGAKKSYEEKLIAYNTRAAMFDSTHEDSGKRTKEGNIKYKHKSNMASGGASLIKEGSYIEGAKEFKNHQAAMAGQKEEVQVKLEDLKIAELDVNDLKVDLESMGLKGATPKEIEIAIMKAIQASKFEVKTKSGAVHSALQADKLQGRLETRTAFSSQEISKASEAAAKQMLDFNKQLKALEDFESKAKAVEAANKAVATASANLAKTIQDTASKLKIPKPDTSGLERALKDAAKDASKMGDELEKVFNKLKKFENLK